MGESYEVILDVQPVDDLGPWAENSWEDGPPEVAPVPVSHTVEKIWDASRRLEIHTLIFDDYFTETQWHLELVVGRGTLLWRYRVSGEKRIRWRAQHVFGITHWQAKVAMLPKGLSVEDVSRQFSRHA